MSRVESELIREFKMAAVVGGGLGYEVPICIATGIRKELVRFVAIGRGKLLGLLEEERWPII